LRPATARHNPDGIHTLGPPASANLAAGHKPVNVHSSLVSKQASYPRCLLRLRDTPSSTSLQPLPTIGASPASGVSSAESATTNSSPDNGVGRTIGSSSIISAGWLAVIAGDHTLMLKVRDKSSSTRDSGRASNMHPLVSGTEETSNKHFAIDVADRLLHSVNAHPLLRIR
jgi:hypothetical protein